MIPVKKSFPFRLIEELKTTSHLATAGYVLTMGFQDNAGLENGTASQPPA